MNILIWLYDLSLFRSEVWLYNICIASMLFHAFSTPMSSTSALVVGRERYNITIALVRIHKYHIYWETWECHTMESLSFILKTCKNSGIMVEQRTWDIVLDLIVLSFNCLRSKWRLQALWLKLIWVSLKVRLVCSNSEENSCLNACVLLRSESMVAASDPFLLSLALLRD